MKVRLSRSGVAVAAGAVATALVGAASVVTIRPGGPPRREVPAVIDLSAGAVRRVVVEAGGRRAELVRDAAGWAAGSGTTAAAAPMLQSAEDQLLPMRAYRMLRVDPADPQYGLAEPVAVVRFEDRTRQEFTVRLGAATFTGAGFYARQDSDSGRLYLVPRNTVDLVRALTTGERVSTADPLRDRAGRYEAEQEETGRDNEVPVYLRQVLDAGGQPPPPPP